MLSASGDTYSNNTQLYTCSNTQLDSAPQSPAACRDSCAHCYSCCEQRFSTHLAYLNRVIRKHQCNQPRAPCSEQSLNRPICSAHRTFSEPDHSHVSSVVHQTAAEHSLRLE